MTSNTMTSSVGAKVKEAREQAGLSPEQLAVEIGVSVATLFRIQRGCDVKVERLAAIARATRKPLSFFLQDAA